MPLELVTVPSLTTSGCFVFFKGTNLMLYNNRLLSVYSTLSSVRSARRCPRVSLNNHRDRVSTYGAH